MRPVVLAALLAALLAVAASASGQTPAPAPFEVGLAVSRSPTVAGTVGATDYGVLPAVVLSVDASGQVYRRGDVDVRLGGVLRAASTEFGGSGLDSPSLHHLGLYAEVGALPLLGGGVRALAGVSLDLGPDFLSGEDLADYASLSADAQDALWLGARYIAFGAGVADGLVVYAGAETFLTLRRSVTLPLTTIEDPDGADSTITFLSDSGNAFNAYVGGSNRVGGLDVGLALHVSGRTASTSEIVGDPRSAGRNRGAFVLSVVPSVAYRAESGLGVEVAMRAPGVLLSEHAVHGIPPVVRRARVGAVPLSLRVDYRW